MLLEEERQKYFCPTLFELWQVCPGKEQPVSTPPGGRGFVVISHFLQLILSFELLRTEFAVINFCSAAELFPNTFSRPSSGRPFSEEMELG